MPDVSAGLTVPVSPPSIVKAGVSLVNSSASSRFCADDDIDFKHTTAAVAATAGEDVSDGEGSRVFLFFARGMLCSGRVGGLVLRARFTDLMGRVSVYLSWVVMG